MDEQYRKRVEEIAREMIRSGEFDHPVNPDRDARLDRNIQDDWSLSYSIRDIPTFDGKGDSLPHTVVLLQCGVSPFKFKSFPNKFRIWNNSSSWFMCNTSKIC